MNKFFIFIIPFAFFFSLGFAEELPQPESMTPEDIYAYALTLDGEGKTDTALKYLDYLVTNNITDKYIFYNLLDIYNKKITQTQILGNNDAASNQVIYYQAKTYADMALKLYPQDKIILYHSADFERYLGNAEAFTNTLNRILSIDEGDIFANYFMGDYYFVNNEMKQASFYFKKVAASARNISEDDLIKVYGSYQKLGMIAFSQQNYKSAIFNFEKAREINSRDYDLLKYIALVYAESLDLEKALEYFKQIPEMYQEDDSINIYAAILFIEKDKALPKVIQEYKSDSSFIRAIDWFQKKKYDKSLLALEEFMLKAKNADYFTHYFLFLNYQAKKDKKKMVQQAFLLGSRLTEVGRYAQAVPYYQIAETDKKSVPEIYWTLGSVFDDMNEYPKAIQYYEKYLNHPDSSVYRSLAQVRLSYLYYKTGNQKKGDKSLQEAKKSAKTKQEILQAHLYSGIINLERKDYTNAAADFELSIKTDVKEPKGYYFLATVDYNERNFSNAIAVLEQGRKQDADNAEMNNLLAYLYSLENVHLDEAAKLANLAVSAYPDNYAFLDTLGWVYYQTGDYTNSFEILNQVKQLIENEKAQEGLDEIYYHLGMIYHQMGNSEQSIKYFQMGNKINPANELILQWLKIEK